jgi:hypothetical protein
MNEKTQDAAARDLPEGAASAARSSAHTGATGGTARK